MIYDSVGAVKFALDAILCYSDITIVSGIEALARSFSSLQTTG